MARKRLPHGRPGPGDDAASRHPWLAFDLHSLPAVMKAILTYHSIEASGSVVSLDPPVFRAHVDWIVREGIRVVTIRELLALPAGMDAIALTFDDGFENFEREAWPLLREHGLPATVFVATNHVGGRNDWNDGRHARIPRLPLLGWKALAALARDGVVLGAHGATHRDLRRLNAMELEREVRQPAERIEAETGRPATDFAYPYGAHDDRVVAAVSAYYSTAVTTELRPVEADEDPHRIPRVDAYYLRRAGRLDGWSSGALRRHLRYRDRLRRVRGLFEGK